MTDTTNPTRTAVVATWEQATDGRRDTNTFDHVEKTLGFDSERVGSYDIIRTYPTQVAECLPEHLDFVDNAFVACPQTASDPAADRVAIADAIREADTRHARLVAEWLG
ncbi:MAG: hypothetical protein Q4G43_06880 [Mobilicoccus sp.]|nr:hypothetical protein [Mobilicoccus sp.]